MKISTLLIGILICGLGCITILSLIQNINNNYGTNVNLDNLSSMNKVNEINAIAQKGKTDIDKISDNPNAFDKLTTIVNGATYGIRSMSVTGDVLNDMVDNSLSHIEGSTSTTIIVIKAIIFITIVIGVIFTAFLKWEV